MIFKNLKIQKEKLSNRIVVSPMCKYAALDGVPSPWHYKHLGSMISSGASMIIIESTAINKTGRITTKDLCLYNARQFYEMKKLIKYLKSIKNIPIIIQLSHAGKKGSSMIPWKKSNSPLKRNGWRTVSASRIKKDKHWPYPRAANKNQIMKIIDDFKKSALFAKKAGIDGIEIHMAHGYLLHQFISPVSNNRQDSYGGCFEKRIKFPLEVIRNVKKITKSNLILGARVTATDHLSSGIRFRESLNLIKQLEIEGLNYVCLSSGGIKTKTKLNPNKKGIRINFAKKAKKEIKNLIIGTTGNLSDLKYLNKTLEKKYLDLAFIGRPFLKNPNWLLNYAYNSGQIKIIPKQYSRAF